MPAPRFQHGFANDVFISYTHADDDEVAGLRWVSRFESQLKARLGQVSGQSIHTWRDNKLSGADRFTPEIQAQLLNSAVLVPIVTPSYFHSKWCDQERAEFIDSAKSSRGLYVGNKARIVKVAKAGVDHSRYPQELKELLEFRFFVTEESGRARDFHLSSDPNVRRLEDTAIDDVAQEIAVILEALEPGGVRAAKGFVYLGESSSDIDAPRSQLRCSLVQQGYEVLPFGPLRLCTGPEVEEKVKADLAQCSLALYPVGADYGPIPERSGGRSLTELQVTLRLSPGKAGGLSL